MKKIDSLFWGISLVLYGLVWGFEILGIIDVSNFVNGWSLFFIIVPCFLGVAFGRHMFESLIGLLFSVFLLFLVNGLVNFLLLVELILPLLFILVGLYMIKKSK